MTVQAAPPNSPPVLLCLGLFDHLAAAGLVIWRPEQGYADVPGFACGFIGTWPDLPDRVLSLTPYGIGDDAGGPMSQLGVQARTRWSGSNWRPVANYSAAIFDALQGLGPLTLSTGISISHVLRQSSGSLGQETAAGKRWSWSDNYLVSLAWPTAHREEG